MWVCVLSDSIECTSDGMRIAIISRSFPIIIYTHTLSCRRCTVTTPSGRAGSQTKQQGIIMIRND